MIDEQRYPDAPSAAEALALDVASRLWAAIAARKQASLVVSGGKSPLPFFAALRTQALDWSKVWITLADERWVDPASPDSNEALVREHLLRDNAAAARFVGLKTPGQTPEEGLAAANEAFVQLPKPFDAVVLGMGADGHTASLFPAMPGLMDALRPEEPPAVVVGVAPNSPEARVSLNLPALLSSRQLFLPIQGSTKWAVYRAARGLNAPTRLKTSKEFLKLQFPVAALFAQESVPMTVQLIDD